MRHQLVHKTAAAICLCRSDRHDVMERLHMAADLHPVRIQMHHRHDLFSVSDDIDLIISGLVGIIIVHKTPGILRKALFVERSRQLVFFFLQLFN